MSSQSTPEVRPELPALETVSGPTAQLMSRAAAEIRVHMEAARLFPRKPMKAFATLMDSCGRPRFAVHAFYDDPYPGPSVHLAREAARCWGNIKYGYRVLEASDDIVDIEGWCWDLETGSFGTVSDRFVPRVPRKQGNETVYITPNTNDLRGLIAARGAKAERAAIFKVVPRDFIDDGEQAARDTIKKFQAQELTMPRGERLKFLVTYFSGRGVSVEMLEAHIGVDLAEISDAQIGELREIQLCTSGKDAEPLEKFFAMRSERDDDEAPASRGAADLNARAKDSSAPEFKPKPAREPEVKREQPRSVQAEPAREVQAERSDRRGTVTPQERMRWITECDKRGLSPDEWPRLRAEHLNGHEVETEGGVS